MRIDFTSSKNSFIIGTSTSFENSQAQSTWCVFAQEKKFGMGGSPAILGAAKAIGQIKPAGVEVHFVVAACEKMTSGTGMRPGDIVTASNGKTIEITQADIGLFFESLCGPA